MIRHSTSRLLTLPDHGELLVCTDLHGNLRDFKRMRRLLEDRIQREANPFLLFTGDLIHGPSCTEEEWPDYLGTFFPDESGEVVESFIELQTKHPARVACLIGNHEHSHVGGPHTPKFWPDETQHFEQAVGPRLTKRFKKLFRTFPAAAVSRCGVVVTHAAPNAEIRGPEEIADIRYEGYEDLPIATLEDMPLLGRLLWSRRCPPQTARGFLDALSVGGLELALVVYGHEIIPEGFERIGSEQLLLSTSFGVRDENKCYLRLDLTRRYRSTDDLREGREILRLYPSKT
jgi:hypothetical protein